MTTRGGAGDPGGGGSGGVSRYGTRLPTRRHAARRLSPSPKSDYVSCFILQAAHPSQFVALKVHRARRRHTPSTLRDADGRGTRHAPAPGRACALRPGPGLSLRLSPHTDRCIPGPEDRAATLPAQPPLSELSSCQTSALTTSTAPHTTGLLLTTLSSCRTGRREPPDCRA